MNYRLTTNFLRELKILRGYLRFLKHIQIVVPNCFQTKRESFDSLALKQNIAPSVQSVVSSATVTPVFGNDLVVITAQAAGLTLANPTGSWVQGKDLVIRIKDNVGPWCRPANQ